MTDMEWVLNEDGSHYAVFLQVPDDPEDPYAVDLLRHAQDERGLLREQRLTLAHYNSYGEAEEHFYQAEQQMQETGLKDFDVEALEDMPYSDTPTILTAIYPPDADDDEIVTANLLAVTDTGIQTSQLALADLESVQDTVLQLDLAQLEGGNEQLLEKAESLAQGSPDTPLFQSDEGIVRHVDAAATIHWFEITERDDDPDFTHELRYFHAHETDDAELQQESYPVMPLPDAERDSAWILPDLERHLKTGNIHVAQQLAYDVAEIYEQDFPDPLDLPTHNPEPEYYFGFGLESSNLLSLDAVKTWTDGSERHFDTLTVGEYGMFEEAAVGEAELDGLLEIEGLEAAMNLAEAMAVAGGYLDPERDDPRIFFEGDAPTDPFMTNREHDLAQPHYTIAAVSANGESFLDVYKEWGAEDYERLVVPQPDWEQAHDVAVQANDLLDEDKLQSAMRLVELEAVKADLIDPDRDDPRLFTQGPVDPFETLAKCLQDEPNPFWNTDGEVIDDPDPELATENPYWRLDALPVNDTGGKPLGHALHMVVYPDVPDGMHIEIVEDTPFKMMEMAHFETEKQMENFSKDFREYLMPGVLEGPELAKEVARLEGLPVEYETLEGQELDDYSNADLTLTRTPEQWHPHNPNAERDARIEAEGMYTNSIFDSISDDDIEF